MIAEKKKSKGLHFLNMSMILDKDSWPSIGQSISVIGAQTEEDFQKGKAFLKEISDLFNSIQEKFNIFPLAQKEPGLERNIIADIVIKIDINKKEVILDRLYKYTNIRMHLFREISRILQCNFSDFILVVPALKGYQLAEEINQYLSNARLGCLYLKGDSGEEFVDSKYLANVSFESILIDTRNHYGEHGGIKNAKCGADISLFLADKRGIGEEKYYGWN